jgi:predicted nucleic acid-binding protein
VNPIDVAADVCRDPNDLPILGTAVAGNADYVVTGDQDLLMLKSYLGITIISPREFYDLISDQG